MSKQSLIIFFLLIQSAFWLGQALNVRYGFFEITALFLAIIVLLLLLNTVIVSSSAAEFASASSASGDGTPRQSLFPSIPKEFSFQLAGLEPGQIVLLLACFLQIVQAGTWLFESADLLFDTWLVAGFMVLATAGLVWSMYSPLGWWLQIAVFVAVGVWVVWGHFPRIDVYMFQQDSSAALLKGVNPYGITFKNPYPDKSPFYSPGMSINGRLQFGYVYMPLTLLLALPGYLLGDVRVAHVLCVALAALFFAGLRPKRYSALTAALFLWMPMIWYLLYLSYTEALIAFVVGAVAYCARKKSPWLFVACGLLIASKQYMVVLLPLLWLLKPLVVEREPDEARRPAVWRQFILKTLAVAMVVTLPMVLGDWNGFLKSALLLQFKQPFREDALSIPALLYKMGFGQMAWWIPFLLLVPSFLLVVKYVPQSAMGFWLGTAWIFFVFFLFNKQAFVNYHYFAYTAMAAAAACLLGQEGVGSPELDAVSLRVEQEVKSSVETR